MNGSGLQKLESRLAVNGQPGNAAIPGGFLQAIIAAIMALMQSCPNPTPANARRRLLNRARLAVGIRKEVPTLTWQEAYTYSDQCLAIAKDASDEDVQEVIDDCCCC